MFNPASLFVAPEVNPINRKARSLPFFNIVNVYGRVFFFSWFSFFLAFWSWYAVPPLLPVTIAKDLKLTKVDVANSNIIALCATLLVRVVAGTACDRFGSRYTFAGCLLIGVIPTFLIGTCFNKHQFFACRFFIGILGGSFVPCQVWSTGFFDKNIVGTANAVAAGLGNAGGGVTYFVMPAIFDSLTKKQHLSAHVAWRVAFIVPGILITAFAIGLLTLCPDTPTGKWNDRHAQVATNLAAHGIEATVVDAPTAGVMDRKTESGSASPSPSNEKVHYDATGDRKVGDHEAQISEQAMLDTARGEVVVKPSFKEVMHVVISPQTLVCLVAYMSTFGAELAINSILGTYYMTNFKHLTQTTSGNWAAMFGLLNVVFRPIGGIVADVLFTYTKTVWSKRAWHLSLVTIMGVFLVIIGKLNPHNENTMFGLIAGMAFFLEAANGALFAYVPHVHPHANGIVSGFTGAAGNLGGIIFAIVFRYNKTNYGKSFWIIGTIGLACNLSLAWVKPIPKGQVGMRTPA